MSTQKTDLTPDQRDLALMFLDDGCSYEEVARTLGVPYTRVRREFPGRSWGLKESASFTAQTRKLWAKIDQVWSIYR